MKSMSKEYGVGEIFNYEGYNLRVMRATCSAECYKCFFSRRDDCSRMNCISSDRKDNESVFFRPVDENAMLYHEIGKSFFFDGMELKAVEAEEVFNCNGCAFENKACVRIPCNASMRKDNKNVKFIEVK